MSRFQDAVVLITGASSGIGLATAAAFAREGAQVVACDVDHQHGEQAIGAIKRAGGRAIFRACDVSQPAEVAALIRGTVDAFGCLDIAFNNAGIEGTQAPIDALPDDAWRKVIDVNLSGVFYCMKHELKQMAAQDGGVIINNSSILGMVGYANACAYTAAKHGLIGLTQCAALEYAPKHIRVNAVCPGFIKTPMLERAGLMREPGVAAQLAAMHPIGRLGEADEVARAVLFLASPEASFITGEALMVDGGYVAR